MIVKFVIDGKIFAVEVYENNENGEVFVHDTYHCNVVEEGLDDVFGSNDQMVVLESGDLMKEHAQEVIRKVEEDYKNTNNNIMESMFYNNCKNVIIQEYNWLSDEKQLELINTVRKLLEEEPSMEEKRKDYIKAILMAWGETGIRMNTDEDEVFLFMEDTQEAFAYLNLEKEWKQVDKNIEKIITKKPDDWFSELYETIDELVDLVMRDL